MPKNKGQTSLRSKRRAENPMREYERLPKELRMWVASAKLPWRAKSVLKSYQKSLAKTGCKKRAIKDLDVLQDRLIAKDVSRIWGDDHPFLSMR